MTPLPQDTIMGTLRPDGDSQDRKKVGMAEMEMGGKVGIGQWGDPMTLTRTSHQNQGMREFLGVSQDPGQHGKTLWLAGRIADLRLFRLGKSLHPSCSVV